MASKRNASKKGETVKRVYYVTVEGRTIREN